MRTGTGVFIKRGPLGTEGRLNEDLQGEAGHVMEGCIHKPGSAGLHQTPEAGGEAWTNSARKLISDF